MENKDLESGIVNLILSLNLPMIKFVEEEYFKLSPAGQYQTCVLTAATVIDDLKNRNKINSRNISSIHKILENQFLKIFDISRDHYIQTDYFLPQYKSPLLNAYNKQGNEVLINVKKEVVKKDLFKLLLVEIYEDLKYYKESLKNYKYGKSKVYNPRLLFINIFFNPFMLLPPHDREKLDIHKLIEKEVSNSRSPLSFRSATFLGEFESYLISVIKQSGK
ncbi:hypothetical protein [Polaribacter sp. IC073]|uniref:hypothetical protein n=1 Tax=Polaribacter sp. IC073 TaxID=2508540 RepID=UPI0011BF38B2|nr:hypothetical protein [Polaribacter sp. IC073]TXD48685.1 hypothetical protein ES045_05515 [Polaribacter sp. IC073]